MLVVDAPVAKDLFGDGGYEAFESLPPPTEEAPAQVMEDVGQPYTTPYTVPEPPPIPGILDRFTPPPAQRTEIGSRRKKPEYVSEAPQVSDFRPTPPPMRTRAVGPPVPSNRDPRSQAQAQAPTRGRGMMWLGIFGILFGLAGFAALAGAAALVFLGPMVDEPEEPDQEVVSGGVEVRGSVGTPPEPMPPPLPIPDPAVPAAPTPGPAPGGAEAAATKGIVKVRANRRVLVYLDDKVIGYTPQSIDLDPGKYTLTAMMPGQPNSRQSREATVTQAGQVVPVDFSF
jgi:hypothetical protein